MVSCEPRLTAGTVESPLPGDRHGGFGERSGETGRWQHRNRAPGRLNCMPQNFICPQRDQPLLMPVDMREWLPEDDLVFVVLDAVAATSSSDAWAVGGLASTQTGLNLRTLILHWDGQTWTQTLSP